MWSKAKNGLVQSSKQEEQAHFLYRKNARFLRLRDKKGTVSNDLKIMLKAVPICLSLINDKAPRSKCMRG